MAYDLTGKVKLIQDEQTFSSGFSKREVIVSVEDGKYSQDICLEFLQDKVSLLDSVTSGQEIKVYFDIRGREYNGKYYNNLVGWKIESVGDSAPGSDVNDHPGAALQEKSDDPSDRDNLVEEDYF